VSGGHGGDPDGTHVDPIAHRHLAGLATGPGDRWAHAARHHHERIAADRS
jgi:hypothetical protein